MLSDELETIPSFSGPASLPTSHPVLTSAWSPFLSTPEQLPALAHIISFEGATLANTPSGIVSHPLFVSSNTFHLSPPDPLSTAPAALITSAPPFDSFTQIPLITGAFPMVSPLEPANPNPNPPSVQTLRCVLQAFSGRGTVQARNRGALGPRQKKIFSVWERTFSWGTPWKQHIGS